MDHSKRVITGIGIDNNGNHFFETLDPHDMSTNTGGTVNVSGASATTAIGGSIGGVQVNSAHYADELSPDYRKDFLVGRLDSSGTYQTFVDIDDDLVLPRTLILDSNVAVLNYENDGTLLTAYNNIILTGQTTGFTAPQFKVTGDFNSTTGTTYSADTDFVDADAVTQRFTKQIAGASSDTNEAIQFGTGATAGDPVNFTITVREKNSPNNADKTISTTFSIIKVKRWCSGTEGRTVSIVPDDNSIVYTVGVGGTQTATPSSITIDATAFNFPSDAKFRFVNQNGVVLKDWTNQTDSNGVPPNRLVLTSPNKFGLAFANPAGGSNVNIRLVEVQVSL